MRTTHLGIGGCSGLTEMGELTNIVTYRLKFSEGCNPLLLAPYLSSQDNRLCFHVVQLYRELLRTA